MLVLGSHAGQAAGQAADLAPTVDTRVELLSIVFRLADLPEFANVPQSPYLREIDRHFAPQQRHSLIARVRQLQRQLRRQGEDVDAWAVLALALHLGAPPGLQPLVPYGATQGADTWDNRWLLDRQLVRLLRRFYRDARCGEFFASQATYYAAVEAQYRRQGIALDPRWLQAFFALPPTEQYRPVLSLFGVGDFGYFRVNYDGARRDTYTLLAVPPAAIGGMPSSINAEVIARSALHEYIHAFTNQAIDRHLPQLRPSAEALLRIPEVSQRTRDTFYDNPTYLLYESLVRASSIVYLTHNSGIDTSRGSEIAAQQKAGFLWVGGLVDLLDKYSGNRDRYRTLEDLMPEIVQFFDKVAAGGAAALR